MGKSMELNILATEWNLDWREKEMKLRRLYAGRSDGTEDQDEEAKIVVGGE